MPEVAASEVLSGNEEQNSFVRASDLEDEAERLQSQARKIRRAAEEADYAARSGYWIRQLRASDDTLKRRIEALEKRVAALEGQKDG